MLIEKTISAENTFTEWKYFKGGSNVDISVSAISDSTVTLQRKFSKYDEALDVETFDSDIETHFFVASSAYYRAGIKAGDYGSDSIKIKLNI